MLLKSIAGCLKPTGRAVIDFHNWWHNPLRSRASCRTTFTAIEAIVDPRPSDLSVKLLFGALLSFLLSRNSILGAGSRESVLRYFLNTHRLSSL